MFRALRPLVLKSIKPFKIQQCSFLTNEYKCLDAWNSRSSAPILQKVNLNDFYVILDQNFNSKGVISAIDVDIFANAIQDSVYLDELRDLLHKLRKSAETINTLESTHHATIRHFIEFGTTRELIDILKEPLIYGVFLDDFTANMLLDNLVTSKNFEQAATVASLIMLQEDYSNDITISLSQYACYKFLQNYVPPEPVPPPEKPKKVEEIKIRIKYLRNPYYDDHFDIKESSLSAGKTLAWMSKEKNDNLNNNLQIIGWLYYKKYDNLLEISKTLSNKTSFLVYQEVLDLLKKEAKNSTLEKEENEKINTSIALLENIKKFDASLEESLKISIENAINKVQKDDIQKQNQLFKSWAELRDEKLAEQTKRLEATKRLQQIQEKQDKLKEEEQKLWFFENEEEIELEIEKKEQMVEEPSGKKTTIKKDDSDYIPPEIIPKRR